jgi:peptide/nickel transport system ATP-binding protein
MNTSPAVLSVRDLTVEFVTERGRFKAVDGVSFEVRRGSMLGLVGESGSGKSVTALAILGLVPAPGRVLGGEVLLHGRDMLRLGRNELAALRGDRIAIVLQDPSTSLNPVLRIETQMTEALHAHRRLSKAAARARSQDALARAGIASPETRLRAYPHQLSGGMRQRVALATALLNKPDVLIADEATTALDVTIQAQILAHLQELSREEGLGVLWITHDLEVIAGLADEVCVMLAGRIVERGSVDAVLDSPVHPYTRSLLDAVPGRHPPGAPLRHRRYRADEVRPLGSRDTP